MGIMLGIALLTVLGGDIYKKFHVYVLAPSTRDIHEMLVMGNRDMPHKKKRLLECVSSNER